MPYNVKEIACYVADNKSDIQSILVEYISVISEQAVDYKKEKHTSDKIIKAKNLYDFFNGVDGSKIN